MGIGRLVRDIDRHGYEACDDRRLYQRLRERPDARGEAILTPRPCRLCRASRGYPVSAGCKEYEELFFMAFCWRLPKSSNLNGLLKNLSRCGVEEATTETITLGWMRSVSNAPRMTTPQMGVFEQPLRT